MKGSEAKMLGFMEGADKRFMIPVYQRKYDWKIENCRQLYSDLCKIVKDGRSSHFFGSVVSSVVANGSKIEYHIIDGQQRLTTVSLLLLAIRNLVKKGLVTSCQGSLDEQIVQRFLLSPWANPDDRIKLRPVKADKQALEKLYGPEEDFDCSSNLTINYQFFYDMILKEDVAVDDLFTAIGKLEIISITLDNGDNPQLIFESLNSTGLALQESDKIRNYILMGQTPAEQYRLYESYWTKIEMCTGSNLSAFIRDFLSIKQQTIPSINTVYAAFKQYAESMQLPVENLLGEILRYARFFEKLQTCRSGLPSQKLDDCLYRLNRLEIVVTRPFFMEVLRLNQDGKLNVDDVRQVFEITESFLFRRNICEVPTNALNKIFLTLNKEILRYDNTPQNYVGKLIYALRNKRDSGRFPDDAEFTEALSNKQIYQMRGKYRAYLFERFENYGTLETKDVYKHLDNGVYSIEHIMPQHPTPTWIEALGPNHEQIHQTWLHRLSNLTLTAYNPGLSNSSFEEKRDAKTYGYSNSGIRMNQKIAQKAQWGETELIERNHDMVELAKTIWSYPESGFKPVEKEFDSCTLDDEDADLTGRDIVKYSYKNLEQPVASWADMLERILKVLHQKDKSILTGFAYGNAITSDLYGYVSREESDLRNAIKVDEGIYFEKNTSTSMKISMLRRLFPLYEADPMDLVFYLRDANADKATDADRHDLRMRYWTYSLPVIREAHAIRGLFSKVNPTTNNVVYAAVGISGFYVSCVANYNEARVDFALSKSDAAKNKEAYDYLFIHKAEIENQFGAQLTWNRADGSKGSFISYHLYNISITDGADWPRMANFHAECSRKLYEVLVPYLYKLYP